MVSDSCLYDACNGIITSREDTGTEKLGYIRKDKPELIRFKGKQMMQSFKLQVLHVIWGSKS